MNEAVLASKAKMGQFSDAEFLIGLAILIGAAEFAQRGCDLFSLKDSGLEEEHGLPCVWSLISKNLCPSIGGRNSDAFSQLFLWIISGKIVIPGLNFLP